MNRRDLLKSFIFVSGGLFFIPYCVGKEEPASITLSNLKLSADDETLIAEIVDTIIPETDTPGARNLGVHLFVLKMVDDCHHPEDQKLFMEGLSEFRKRAKEQLGKSFDEAELGEREKLLAEIGKDNTDAVGRFFEIIHKRSVLGYTNSEYVMTHLTRYELVPARYNGFMHV